MDRVVPDLALFVKEGRGTDSFSQQIEKISDPAAVEAVNGIPGKTDLKRARYLAIWDRSIIPGPGVIPALIDFMDQTPEAGMASPSLVHRGGILPTFGRPPSFLKVVIKSRIDLTLPVIDRSPVEVFTISAPAAVMRPEMLSETGFPSPRPGGLEALCRRARKLGWHLYGLPQAVCRVDGDPQRFASRLGFIDICRYISGSW